MSVFITKEIWKGYFCPPKEKDSKLNEHTFQTKTDRTENNKFEKGQKKKKKTKAKRNSMTNTKKKKLEEEDDWEETK